MRDIVLSELRESCEMLRFGADEIVPRFRIVEPTGPVTLLVPLPDDETERYRRLGLIKTYMAVKMATGFTLATETIEPNCLAVTGVSREHGLMGAFQHIDRNPLRFSEPEWLPTTHIDPGLKEMLPGEVSEVTAQEVAAVEAMMGDHAIELQP